MTPTKIDTGNTLQNLMYYIFITNEYGKPTERTISMFELTFGNVILNKNLGQYINDNIKNTLDNWWKQVEIDLNERDLKSCAHYNGGFDWFKALYLRSKELDKDTIDTYKEDREQFKQWILSIDINNCEYISETVNTPENITPKQKYVLKIHKISRLAQRRKQLTLLNIDKDTGKVRDQLLLNTEDGTVIVQKSQCKYTDYRYNSFEEYIRHSLMIINHTNEYNEKIHNEVETIMQRIKNAEKWEVKVGNMYKPMSIVFNWEEN